MPNETATDLFLSLTPNKVIEAVEASGVLCNPVCYPLNSFENRVYEVECEDRTRLIAKFYRPGRWTREQVLEEHQFLTDLEEAEIPVCPTQPFPDGGTLRPLDHLWYCLFPRRGGRAPDELTDEDATRLGRLTARIHNVGASREARHRVRLSGNAYVRDHLAWFAAHKTLPPAIESRYVRAANLIADRADELLAEVDVHRIHGDLHHGNLLLRDSVFHVLDFDDMLVGPAVQDLWLLLPGRDVETHRARELFLEAYESIRRFDRRSLALIEPLRGLRMVHYAAWIARRWHDPIFPRTFVHYGTPVYWEEQTRDLEEVVELLDGPRPAAQTVDSTKEEKYFWDMDE